MVRHSGRYLWHAPRGGVRRGVPPGPRASAPVQSSTVRGRFTLRWTTCTGSGTSCHTTETRSASARSHSTLPRPAQRRQVGDAVQGERELFQIRGGLGVRERVEEHAGLERGERVDVLDVAPVGRQLVDLLPGTGRPEGSPTGVRRRRPVRRSVRRKSAELLGELAWRAASTVSSVVHSVGVRPGKGQRPSCTAPTTSIRWVRCSPGACSWPSTGPASDRSGTRRRTASARPCRPSTAARGS